MAQALLSGCDVLSNWATAGQDIAATLFDNSNQNGSTGPAPGTNMRFVGKYTTNLTLAQLNNLTGNGLSVFFFYENGSINPDTGVHGPQPSLATYAQGAADANTAKNNLTALGIWPLPVYFAIDYNAPTTDIITYIYKYFEGITDTIGNNQVGFYGSVGARDDLQLAMNNDGYQGPKYFCQSRSSGWRGNGNFVSGMNLWQWPPGYSPGGNAVAGGVPVDGEFAYTSDFGQYPKIAFPPDGGGGTGVVTPPSPPPPGQQTAGSVGEIDATFTQPYIKTLVVPNDRHDEIIYSNTFKTTVTNTVGSYTLGPFVNIKEPAYPLGNFSYDNQTTWADFGFIFAGDFGAFPGSLPAVVVQAEVTSSGDLQFNVAVNQVLGDATDIDLIINVALLYAPQMVPAETVPNTTTGQKLSYGTSINPSNIIPIYGGHVNQTKADYASYRRIQTDDSVDTGSATVAHGLDDIPNLVFWGFDGSVLTQPVVWASDGAVAAHLGIAMDSTNIYFNVDVDLQKVYYRTYKDN